MIRAIHEFLEGFVIGYRRGREKRRRRKAATLQPGQQIKFAMDQGAELTGKSVAEKLAKEIKGKDWANVGLDIGGAIMTGLLTAMGKKLEHAFFGGDASENPIKFDPAHGGLANFFDWLVKNFPAGGLQFAEGGIVPGRTGQPQLAMVHGGERVLTPEQQRNSGGNSISINIYGATDTAETERAVRRALIDALGNS